MQRVNTERKRECDRGRGDDVLYRQASGRLTYVGQQEERGVVLQQEGVRAHRDGDVDRLNLLSIGTVLLVHTLGAMATVVNPTLEPAGG